MGLVVCQKHGNGFMFVCPHVRDAVAARESCHGIEYLTYTNAELELDGIELACWFCPACIQDNQLPVSGTVIVDGEEFMKRTGRLYRPMCPGCFNDWRDQVLG
jgi:hypothetical protein